MLVQGMSHQEKAPRWTQETLERIYLLAGLGMPRGPPGGALGGGWVEGSLGFHA